MFAEKLDLIMRLTNTQSSALSRACLLNASYVSRLRSGARPLPKRPVFLRDMSVYLARRVTTDYQKTVLTDAMKLTIWPQDEARTAELIERWLSGSEEVSPDVERILAGFASPPPAVSAAPEDPAGLPKARNYYYGPKGKQEAVLQFFDLVLKEKTPQTLLLSSDEEAGWMFDDPAFASRWAGEFRKVLLAGNRAKIIHSIGRSMNEMLEAVSRWLPIYMTGMIEPYYYPKLRDGVFQRTLFLAPKTAAIVSASVERKTEGMLNELITDRDAVTALTGEFDRYLSLCRPLMQIMTAEKSEELWNAYGALSGGDGDLICMSSLPTLATMPVRVAEAMQERAPGSCILAQHRSAAKFLRELPETVRYLEILPDDLQSIEPPELPGGEFLGAPGLRYTAEEWQAHLEAAHTFADCSGQHHKVPSSSIPENITIFVKEGRGAIVRKDGSPSIAFAFSEANIVNAFWSYLSRRG